MNEKTQTLESAALPIVVKIKPGNASEKGVTFLLPQEQMELSLTDIVKYSLTREDTRKNERVAGRLQTEMSKQYGMIVNGAVANASETIDKYLSNVQQLEDGTKYKLLEIIVASKQEGGYKSLYNYRRF